LSNHLSNYPKSKNTFIYPSSVANSIDISAATSAAISAAIFPSSFGYLSESIEKSAVTLAKKSSTYSLHKSHMSKRKNPIHPIAEEFQRIWLHLCRASIKNDTNLVIDCMNNIINSIDGPPLQPMNSSSTILRKCTSKAAKKIQSCLNWVCETPISLSTATHVNMNISMSGTPLIFASVSGSLLVCEQLLSYGANVHVCNDHGDSPIMCASYFGHHNIVNMLLEKNANPNTTNFNGATALMYAVERGNMKTIKLLVEKGGVSVSIQDLDGNTALTIAESKGFTEIEVYLNRNV
jgi:hypothetical protein